MVVNNILPLTLICHTNHFKVFYREEGEEKIILGSKLVVESDLTDRG
jgi:hypothetical protein